MENDIPRRNKIDLYSDAELAIHKAMEEVEKLGASESLTNAIVKLNEAKNLVADFIDNKEAKLKKARMSLGELMNSYKEDFGKTNSFKELKEEIKEFYKENFLKELNI